MATQVAFELTANGNQAQAAVKELKDQLKQAQAEAKKIADEFGETSQEAINAKEKIKQLGSGLLEAQENTKGLKQKIKEANIELIAMQEQFGKSSEQAINAAKKVAALKDTIQDAKEQADLFDPGNKFKAFSNAASQVAAGFSAVQGAMALVGSESEDVQKSLLKVQGALALSQGLSQLGDLGKAFDELKIVAVNAFRTIKAAIGSSGIGLLLIALGAIVAYWDDIKAAVSGVSEEQKKLLETQKKSAAAAEKSLDSISKSENILKLNGKSEKDILNLKIAATKQTITQLEAQLTTQKTMRQSQIDAAKRNKDILQGILKFLTAPVTVLLKAVDALGKIAGKDFGLEDKFFGGIAKMVFDPEEVATEGDKAIAETETKLTELKNSQAGFQLQIQQINKDAANKSAEDTKKRNADADADRKKREADEKARLDNLAAQNKHTDELIQQNRLSAIKDGFTKRQMELATQEQKEIDDELERLNNKLITQEQYEINRNNIVQKYANLQTQLIIDEEAKRKEKDDADKQKKIEDEKSYNEALLQAEKELQDAKFSIVEGGISALQTLAQGNDKLSNILFAVEKAAAIAKIIVNTQSEIAGYYANPTWSLMPDGGLALKTAASLKAKIRAGVSIGTILATTIAKYKQGGGGNVPTPPISQIGMNPPLTPQVQTTNLNQAQINQLASATTRAFVLESDVSGNQERIRRINRAARIN